MAALERLKRMDGETLTGIGIALAVLLFVSINVLAQNVLRFARVDLTQDRLYTLSAGTRAVLKGIEEPIVFRFYFSRILVEHTPIYANYGARVKELLEQYAGLSGGRIKLQVFDPANYSPEEDQAVAYGLQGLRLNRAGDRAYLGLVASNTTDDEEVIPFFDPDREPHLEYELTRMVFNLAHPKKKVVGVLTELQMQGDMRRSGPWALLQQMRQFFDVRFLDREFEAVDPEVNVLMVVHPEGLSDKTQYAIDQYVLGGGRALVFVDPHSEIGMRSPMGDGMGNQPSQIKLLFDAWGIDFSPDTFVGDLGNAMRVGASSEGRIVPVDYLAWIAPGAEHVNRDDVITSQVQRLAFGSAGALAAKEGASTSFTPLVSSSTRSMRISTNQVAFRHDPVRLLQRFQAENRAFTLAARVQGPVKTAFPDGPPPEKKAKPGAEAAEPKAEASLENKTPRPAHRAESAAPVNLVVVADTDMLTDRMWIDAREMLGQRVSVPTASNADFVINALDNLMGSGDLIGLRSRGLSIRPFHRLDAIQREAELRYRKTEQGLQEKLKEVEEKLANMQREE
ncbi:MAG: hypothetical protein HW381_1215, partial [Candidatus Rokubacteria bacterium]|nr:hypothetical protein [Candidatus Rokubacteria bacterium]